MDRFNSLIHYFVAHSSKCLYTPYEEINTNPPNSPAAKNPPNVSKLQGCQTPNFQAPGFANSKVFKIQIFKLQIFKLQKFPIEGRRQWEKPERGIAI